MPTQLTPKYVPEYWKTLQEGLYFEAEPPKIVEFETIAEANEWVKSKFSTRGLKVRMGLFKPTVTINAEPQLFSIPGELSFMISVFKNKGVIWTQVQYQMGKIDEKQIIGKNFAHQDIFADHLVIRTKGSLEATRLYLRDGDLDVDSDKAQMLGIIHELCEHAFNYAYPSYDFAVQQKMSRMSLIAKGELVYSGNPDADILECVAAQLAYGYRHSLVNIVNAWALEQYGENGATIVSALRKGVLNMFAENLRKYKSPEDIKTNYGKHVGEYVAFLSSFLEENLTSEMLQRHEYSNGIRPSIDAEISYTPWTLTPAQFENIQNRATTYLEQHGFRKVELI